MAHMTTDYLAKDVPKMMSPRELISPLFRRKKLLFLVFLGTFAAIVILSFIFPSPYRSEMSILVNRERQDPLVSTESTTQVPPGAQEVTLEEITSEAALLQSADLLEKVVLATGLADDHGFSVWKLLHPFRTQQDKVAFAVKELAKQLKVTNEINSNLIDVTYGSKDPKTSYAVLNSLANFYLEKHVAVHRSPGSYQFFADETDRYRQALEASERKLREYGQKEGVAAPDMVRTDMAQQLALTVGELHTAQQAAAADEQKLQSDKRQMSVIPARSPTQQASSQADRLLDQYRATLLAAQTKRTQLALKYDPHYPLVQEVDEEIAQTQAAIADAEKTQYLTQTTDRDPTYELLREDIAKTQADLAAQRATASAALASVKSMQNQMVDLDQKALTQHDLQREAKADEDNYLLYLSKREQERTTDALDKTGIANVAIAVPPAIPVLPVYSMPIVLAVALGLALFLSIATAYAVNYFDATFHTPNQVIETLGIPIVVGMPRKAA
ncbi:GumC family protein [Tunturiibacter lichenicola]|uniref:GumC family protein n=1 Tax=Tunturiibacter lichenicola TaxID=2051959 RepID=UPI0021B188D9|nr:Wzz/FepE/Etk N-terminal domain-containing protein [Edaphobacter lichenicola]